jgi:hypothetical protein
MKEDDANWPPADRVGKQELEIKLNGEHICFNTTKLGSVLQVQQSKDPDGLRIFYYLVQVGGGLGVGLGGLCVFVAVAGVQRARPRAAGCSSPAPAHGLSTKTPAPPRPAPPRPARTSSASRFR